MDTRLKSSVTFLTLILLVSLFVSEARPLVSPLLENEGVIGKVNGIFRTLKDSGPSPGVGHRLKKLENLEGMKNSGPSSGGVGHKYNPDEVLGVIKHSVPSPGEGHK